MEKSVTRLDFLWIELTNECNLKCVHCYADSGPGAGVSDRLSTEDYERTLQDAHDQGCRRVQFIGGEATLNRNLVRLIRTAQSIGFNDIEVYSNLVSLPSSFIAILEEGQVKVATSVYAADPDIHDAITGQPGSWRKSISNLRKLIALGVDVRASIIVMDVNRAEQEPAKQFLREIGVKHIGYDDARPFGRASEGHACSDLNQLCGNCSNGVACVSAEGKVFPCIMSRAWEIGDLASQSLTEIMAGGAIRDFRSALDEVNADRVLALCSPDPDKCSPCAPAVCSPGSECTPHRICPPKPPLASGHVEADA